MEIVNIYNDYAKVCFELWFLIVLIIKLQHCGKPGTCII